MRTNFNDNVKNPQLRAFLKEKGQFQDLTATNVAIPANRLVEVTSNTIQAGTDDDANILGAVLAPVDASGQADVDFGVVEVLLSGKVSQLDKVAGAASGRVRKFLSEQGEILEATAGGNFGNQPAGDTVEVVSDSTDDVGQTVTLYYTKTGATATVSSEVLTLNGTTAAETSIATIQNVLGVVISADHAGTITVQKKTGGDDIVTIATGTLSAGVHATTAEDAYGAIGTIKAGAASTKLFGVIGTDVDGNAQTFVGQLNGTTDVPLGTSPWNTIDTVLIGDVASASTATVETKAADTNAIGIALEDGTTGEVIKIYMKPFGL
jgi:hypothetical protein